MTLSIADLDLIRDEIGTTEPPTDYDLDDIYARVGTVTDVVRVVLSRRLADRENRPASITVPGEYAETWGSTVDLARRVAALGGSTLAPPADPGVGVIARTDRGR